MKVIYDEVNSPLGRLTLVMSEDNLLRIDFGSYEENKEKILTYLKRIDSYKSIGRSPINHDIKEQLNEYFRQARKVFTAPHYFYGTEFQKEVWQALLTIPYGETISYKQLAERINRPKAVRAVGGALNKNPFSIIVPCHRVIGSDGSLTGFGGGLDRKKQLLMFEKENK